MKRINYLHELVSTQQNIELADERARHNKTKRYGVLKHDKTHDEQNARLQYWFSYLLYKTSEYDTFKIYEPKERIIYRLPYFPDRIAHHALMNILEPIWIKIFIKNTYSCVKRRGIHKCAKDLKEDLRDYPEQTTYCLKMDVRKFYPSIDHEILKQILRRKIKDEYLLKILNEIIDSADGVPIGNYLSQFFANLYLTYFDHWMKEEVKAKFYYRYADDIVILSNDKRWLHNVLCAIKIYLKYELKLQLKPNYQIFPVEERGIDFVGYVFRHNYTLLRKSIKMHIRKLVQRFEDGKITRDEFMVSMSSYKGWLLYCDSHNLCKWIQFHTGVRISRWNGKRTSISRFWNKLIFVYAIIPHPRYYEIECLHNGKPFIIRSNDLHIWKRLHRKRKFPCLFKVTRYIREKAKNMTEIDIENYLNDLDRNGKTQDEIGISRIDEEDRIESLGCLWEDSCGIIQ